MARRSQASEPPTDWRDQLRRYRLTQNIKQAALAADLGVTQAMISRWEAGLVDPSPVMQQRIRALLASEAAIPLVDWRSHVAQQPGLAAVIHPFGEVETISLGLARLLDRPAAKIEGQHLDDLFRGDLPQLFRRLKRTGFFDETAESVESADKYCFVDKNGHVVSHCVHGLHWPHRGEEGEIRWMLTGAKIGQAEFDRLRRNLTGHTGKVLAE
ncbi:helix-turn-helix transcriptional regulator [Maricaulis parjimensis]|uniref:helix-turn-helix transcriptional regulator n=1 Tax=Maricaulis parjimensis TaxID=144023 RepID=UPI0023AEBCB1|nr:helix-turn-helix transcriptional regulator [Maricaulis parjimensis]